ncbi:MAG: hypothetical protein Q4F65_06955 [Propionibacteriaceae bacterium]|nr:hypothetical protein [Propionibacteriaceae bacterium]
MAATVTSLETVLAALGVSTSPHVEAAYAAAEDAVASLCVWPQVDEGGEPIAAPGALVQAVALRTNRLLARRNSPDGIVGVGEFGPVRVSAVDRDIEELEKPYRRVVFG